MKLFCNSAEPLYFSFERILSTTAEPHLVLPAGVGIPSSVRIFAIKVFLMDGEPTGRIKCSLANWTGIAYKVPRTALDKCKDLDLLKQSGVYFLFGTDKADNAVVYIGQAGVRKNGKGLLLRIQEAHTSIDYWTEAVMFTTTNNSFGPTEISFLENRFCNMAVQAGRYVVKNGNDPNPGNITEETESELEEFIDYAKIVMGVLGHKVFEPLAPSSEASDNEPTLYMEYGRGKASGKRTSDGFVVFKGSVINPTMTKSCPERTIKDRKKYVAKIDKNSILTADILFSSPSSAAGFVGGASLSGNSLWKNAEGRLLKDLINE